MSGPGRPALRRVVVGPLATNCWALVDAGQALIVDPGDEPEGILTAVAGLDVVAIVLTHAHWDHVLGLPDVAEVLGASVFAHPADSPVWPHERAELRRQGHWDAGTATSALLASDPTRLTPEPGRRLWNGIFERVDDGDTIRVGRTEVRVLHTPGHTPGGLSLHVPGHVLTGDTLFPGGPGLTGWPLSDFPTIMDSVRRLLALPEDTLIHPGHGADTTVAAERPQLAEWQRRGW